MTSLLHPVKAAPIGGNRSQYIPLDQSDCCSAFRGAVPHRRKKRSLRAKERSRLRAEKRRLMLIEQEIEAVLHESSAESNRHEGRTVLPPSFAPLNISNLKDDANRFFPLPLLLQSKTMVSENSSSHAQGSPDPGYLLNPFKHTSPTHRGIYSEKVEQTSKPAHESKSAHGSQLPYLSAEEAALHFLSTNHVSSTARCRSGLIKNLSDFEREEIGEVISPCLTFTDVKTLGRPPPIVGPPPLDPLEETNPFTMPKSIDASATLNTNDKQNVNLEVFHANPISPVLSRPIISPAYSFNPQQLTSPSLSPPHSPSQPPSPPLFSQTVKSNPFSSASTFGIYTHPSVPNKEAVNKFPQHVKASQYISPGSSNTLSKQPNSSSNCRYGTLESSGGVANSMNHSPPTHYGMSNVARPVEDPSNFFKPSENAYLAKLDTFKSPDHQCYISGGNGDKHILGESELILSNPKKDAVHPPRMNPLPTGTLEKEHYPPNNVEDVCISTKSECFRNLKGQGDNTIFGNDDIRGNDDIFSNEFFLKNAKNDSFPVEENNIFLNPALKSLYISLEGGKPSNAFEERDKTSIYQQNANEYLSSFSSTPSFPSSHNVHTNAYSSSYFGAATNKCFVNAGSNGTFAHIANDFSSANPSNASGPMEVPRSGNNLVYGKKTSSSTPHYVSHGSASSLGPSPSPGDERLYVKTPIHGTNPTYPSKSCNASLIPYDNKGNVLSFESNGKLHAYDSSCSPSPYEGNSSLYPYDGKGNVHAYDNSGLHAYDVNGGSHACESNVNHGSTPVHKGKAHHAQNVCSFREEDYETSQKQPFDPIKNHFHPNGLCHLKGPVPDVTDGNCDTHHPMGGKANTNSLLSSPFFVHQSPNAFLTGNEGGWSNKKSLLSSNVTPSDFSSWPNKASVIGRNNTNNYSICDTTAVIGGKCHPSVHPTNALSSNGAHSSSSCTGSNPCMAANSSSSNNCRTQANATGNSATATTKLCGSCVNNNTPCVCNTCRRSPQCANHGSNKSLLQANSSNSSSTVAHTAINASCGSFTQNCIWDTPDQEHVTKASTSVQTEEDHIYQKERIKSTKEASVQCSLLQIEEGKKMVINILGKKFVAVPEEDFGLPGTAPSYASNLFLPPPVVNSPLSLPYFNSPFAPSGAMANSTMPTPFPSSIGIGGSTLSPSLPPTNGKSVSVMSPSFPSSNNKGGSGASPSLHPSSRVGNNAMSPGFNTTGSLAKASMGVAMPPPSSMPPPPLPPHPSSTSSFPSPTPCHPLFYQFLNTPPFDPINGASPLPPPLFSPAAPPPPSPPLLSPFQTSPQKSANSSKKI